MRVEEVVKGKGVLEYEEPLTRTKNVFEAEAKTLHYVQVLGMYSSAPEVKPLQHMIVAECGVHLSWKGFPESEMLRCRLQESLGCCNCSSRVFDCSCKRSTSFSQ